MAGRLESIALRASSMKLPAPSPALAHAVRLGAATAGALWLTHLAGFPKPTWPLITVLMVAQPTSGATLQKGILRLIGTLAAAPTAIAIYGLFAQDQLLLIASICVVYAVSVYGMTGPRNAYAWNAFGFTTGVILGSIGPETQIENLAFDRAALVGIGLLASFAAEALFWPVRPEDELRASLTARAQQIREALQWTRDRLHTTGSPSGPAVAIAPARLITQLGLIDQLRNEMGVTRARTRHFANVALNLDALEASVRALAAGAQSETALQATRLRVSFESLLDGSIEALRETERALRVTGEPARSAPILGSELLNFDQARADELAKLIGPDPEHRGEPATARAIVSLSTLAPTLRGMVDLLGDIETSLTAIAQEDAGIASEDASEPAISPPSRWFTLDPLRVEQALRSGIAVGSVFIVMPLIRWPVSSMPMTLAYLMAQLPTRAAMTMTATAFIAVGIAAWIVSDLSIIYIAPHLGRFPQALIYPIAVAGAAGYASVRFPKLAPLAPSAAMIVILIVFGGVHAPDNVAGPYQTTAIIVTGVLIGLVAGRLLWPRTAAELFLEHAARQLELCLRLLDASEPRADSDTRRSLAAEVRIGYVQRLTQLAQLDAQARAEPVVQELDDERRTRLLAACAELLEASFRARLPEIGGIEEEPPFDLPALSPLRDALEQLDEAVAISVIAMIGTLRGELSWRRSGLDEANNRVEMRIADLRRMQESAEALGGRNAAALLSRIDEKRRLASRAAAIEAWLEDWSRARTLATQNGQT